MTAFSPRTAWLRRPRAWTSALTLVAASSAGCSLQAMTGDLMSDYAVHHLEPFLHGTDDAEMVQRRVRQANLMGPAGYVSVDDSEMMMCTQQGIAPYPESVGVLEMGGRDWAEETPHSVTESLTRGFYAHYRTVMGL